MPNRIAVDEADSRVSRSCSQRGDTERITALDHQAHFARHKTDDAVQRGDEPALAPQYSFAQLALRQMHAGKIAAVVRQRDQRILIADVAQVDVDVLSRAPAVRAASKRQSHDWHERAPPAGLCGNSWLISVSSSCDRFCNCGPSRACSRCPAQTSFSPSGVRLRAAPLPAAPRAAHRKTPTILDQIPAVPVGQPGATCGPCDFPGGANFVQEIQHHAHGVGVVVAAKVPYRIDIDADHRLTFSPRDMTLHAYH